MIYNRSRHIQVDFLQIPHKFLRPNAAVQVSWLPRWNEIRNRGEDWDFGTSEDITEMSDQIAEFCMQIGDEVGPWEGSQFLESLAPHEIASLWFQFVMGCQLDEKGREALGKQSKSLSAKPKAGKPNTNAEQVATTESDMLEDARKDLSSPTPLNGQNGNPSHRDALSR